MPIDRQKRRDAQDVPGCAACGTASVGNTWPGAFVWAVHSRPKVLKDAVPGVTIAYSRAKFRGLGIVSDICISHAAT